MQRYKNLETGEIVSGRELFGRLKSGTWDGNELPDGSWHITPTDEDEGFVLEPL